VLALDTLDRDDSVEARVPRFPHLTHSARANRTG
jgi:hypothetical protein